MTQKRTDGALLNVLWLCLVMLLPRIVLASGGDVLTSSVGGYQVSLFFIEAAKVGSVPVRIKITDKMGMPIDTAHVEVNGMQGMSDMDMGEHGHDMSNMVSVPTVVLYKEVLNKTGNYFGIIPFSMDGDWVLSTHFSINGQMFAVDFPVEVARNSTALVVLLGFACLNALVIWSASVAKRNAVST